VLAQAGVTGVFEGEVLLVDPDFAAVGVGVGFALTEVEGAVAVVAIGVVVEQRLVADVAH
jgi:hypothetical protein